MTLFSQENDDTAPKAVLQVHMNKQENGFEIESLIKKYGLTYLEATTQWLEENSIPEAQFARYIPGIIIEQISNEAVDENLLRPSMNKLQKTNTLDFLL